MLEFAAFLQQHHLDDVARENLNSIQSHDIPMMRLVADKSEAELLRSTRSALDRFFHNIVAGRAPKAASELLNLCADLSGKTMEAIQASDLVLMSFCQKRAILKFIPHFTRDPNRIMDIVFEWESYYDLNLTEAFQIITNLHLDASARAAGAEADILAVNAVRTEALNAELTLQRAEADEASRLKSAFLANMSHELRTPLNSILGYTELVLKSRKLSLDDQSRANLGVVIKNGKHLLALINEVLDLSKIEAGKATVYADSVNPRTLLQGVIRTAEPLARAKRLELRLEVDPALGTVVTDEIKVQQIVINLVSNAIKFTQTGSITLRARSRGTDGWAIDVEDSGSGIAPEHLDLIFEEFRQVDASSTRVAGGTGLGLAIARKLAHLLGGELVLESEVGRGSTFRLEMPHLTIIDKPATLSQSAWDFDTDGIPHLDGKMPVVAIDDDPAMLHLIAEWLKDTPYVAIPASSGESGLRLARQMKPVAIMLDIIMPHKDGWAVLLELKNDPETSDIPVLIMSCIDSKMYGYSLGADAYLTKPIDMTKLLGTLERLNKTERAAGYVLVIDDDPEVRGLYREVFAEEGIRLVEAADGQEGIEAIERALPSLVILDLMMPRMDGFEVLAWLRSHQVACEVPVIVITAKDLTPFDRNRLANAQSIFCKGVTNREELLSELRGLQAAGVKIMGNAQ